MGKAVEKIALEKNHEIVGRVDLGDVKPYPVADVAIEFSQPDAAIHNLKKCIDAKIPVVCGTTGWYNEKEDIEKYCLERNGTLFYASNFSLGVNIFFLLNEYLARWMDPHPDYRVAIDETHHTQKKDSPSGTALMLAEGIIKNSSQKKEWATPENPKPGAVVISSFRVDPAPGTHVVRYQSPADDIEIKHMAHSREGFASGAVQVAEWLVGKHGVFTMKDFLKF